MATIHDVAAHIVAHFPSGLSPMKLQKLTYFSQGWSLGLLQKPLFEEDFEAWVNGPVSYDLFDIHRGDWSVGSWTHGDPSRLTVRERTVVDAVLSQFGALSGKELSDLTHRAGTPWHQVRTRLQLGPNQRTREVIDHDSMRRYFYSALS